MGFDGEESDVETSAADVEILISLSPEIEVVMPVPPSMLKVSEVATVVLVLSSAANLMESMPSTSSVVPAEPVSIHCPYPLSTTYTYRPPESVSNQVSPSTGDVGGES